MWLRSKRAPLQLEYQLIDLCPFSGHRRHKAGDDRQTKGLQSLHIKRSYHYDPSSQKIFEESHLHKDWLRGRPEQNTVECFVNTKNWKWRIGYVSRHVNKVWYVHNDFESRKPCRNCLFFNHDGGARNRRNRRTGEDAICLIISSLSCYKRRALGKTEG